KRYEDCGRNQTASRMLPSDQSFKADNAPINQRFRLIDKLKFAFFEGRHEVVLNLATFAQLAIHFRLEEPVGTGTFRLGAIECRVGIANQLVTFGGVAWVDRHPYTDVCGQLPSINLDKIAQRRNNPLGQTSSRIKQLGSCHDECELITADARQKGAVDRRFQPLCHLAKKGIADRMTK